MGEFGRAFSQIADALDPFPIRDQMRALAAAAIMTGCYANAQELLDRLRYSEPIGDALVAWGEAIRTRSVRQSCDATKEDP